MNPATEPDYGNAIPRFVQFTSPVSTDDAVDRSSPVALPLNLIALITQWIDDTASLASLCRTCRLLYYMTLPQLYQRVALRSYAEIRYVNGRPEGFGGGSPFVMALNGLMTQSHTASLVEEFRVWGSWREEGHESFAKGRVPDNSMMLAILMRSATDKMAKLRTFSWELDCKPLKTLYQGLATHVTLTNLTLRFPGSRVPRPSVMIPPMKSLRVFKATDIDPLCYPDDISMLLLGSPMLLDLRLHFSPRMRREAEPTLSLSTYFGRCAKANYSIPCTHFAMQNWFGPMDMFSMQTCRSVTFLDTFGGIGSGGNAQNVYVDDTWKDLPPVSCHQRDRVKVEFGLTIVMHSTRICVPDLNHTGRTRYLDSQPVRADNLLKTHTLTGRKPARRAPPSQRRWRDEHVLRRRQNPQTRRRGLRPYEPHHARRLPTR